MDVRGLVLFSGTLEREFEACGDYQKNDAYRNGTTHRSSPPVPQLKAIQLRSSIRTELASGVHDPA